MPLIEPQIERLKSDVIRLAWACPNDEPIEIFSVQQASKNQENKMYLTSTREKYIDLNVPTHQRVYFLLQQGERQQVISERVLPLEGAHNFRDLGGYKTTEGKNVKWGVFYRSDHLNKLTDNDINYLSSIHLKTIVDYRAAHEYSKQPNHIWDDSIQTVRIIPDTPTAELAAQASNDHEKIQEIISLKKHSSLHQEIINGSGQIMEEQNREFIRNPMIGECYRQLIDLILDPNNQPMVQHCRGGKDRTGFGAAIILYLLGVDLDTIIYDYMLTGELRANRNARRMGEYEQQTQDKEILAFLSSIMETRASYIQAAFDEMIKLHGSIDNYMTQVLKITDEEINTLRQLYVE